MVDEVSLWKGVLTPAEIAQLAAGTSPTDLTGGALEITSITRESSGNIVLTWNSSPNATYNVEVNTDLGENWVEVGLGVVSQGNTTSFTFVPGFPGLDPTIEPRLFFRVRQ
jgi:hypothetical protein